MIFTTDESPTFWQTTTRSWDLITPEALPWSRATFRTDSFVALVDSAWKTKWILIITSHHIISQSLISSVRSYQLICTTQWKYTKTWQTKPLGDRLFLIEVSRLTAILCINREVKYNKNNTKNDTNTENDHQHDNGGVKNKPTTTNSYQQNHFCRAISYTHKLSGITTSSHSLPAFSHKLDRKSVV